MEHRIGSKNLWPLRAAYLNEPKIAKSTDTQTEHLSFGVKHALQGFGEPQLAVGLTYVEPGRQTQSLRHTISDHRSQVPAMAPLQMPSAHP